MTGRLVATAIVVVLVTTACSTLVDRQPAVAPDSVVEVTDAPASLAEVVARQLETGDTRCDESSALRQEACILFQGALATSTGSGFDYFDAGRGSSGIDPEAARRAQADPSFQAAYVISVANTVPILSSMPAFAFQWAALGGDLKQPGADPETCLDLRYGLCGNQTALALALFEHAGLSARPVAFYFQTDSGRVSHSVVEVLVGARWRLVDTTHGAHWPGSGSLGTDLASTEDVIALESPGESARWNSGLLWVSRAGYEPFEYLTSDPDVIRGGHGSIRLDLADPEGFELLEHRPSFVGDNTADGRAAGVEFTLEAPPGAYELVLDVTGIGGSDGSICVDDDCRPFPPEPVVMTFTVEDPTRLHVASAADVAYLVLGSIDWSRS